MPKCHGGPADGQRVRLERHEVREGHVHRVSVQKPFDISKAPMDVVEVFYYKVHTMHAGDNPTIFFLLPADKDVDEFFRELLE
jgi:hypothetical protein